MPWSEGPLPSLLSRPDGLVFGLKPLTQTDPLRTVELLLMGRQGDKLLPMDQEPALSDLLADRAHLSHLLQDFTSGVVSATDEDIAALREELGLIEGQISVSTGGEPMFTWNDFVVVVDHAPTAQRPGATASIVGISRQYERSGTYLEEFPTGNVYTVEFDDGASVDVPQGMLHAT